MPAAAVITVATRQALHILSQITPVGRRDSHEPAADRAKAPAAGTGTAAAGPALAARGRTGREVTNSARIARNLRAVVQIWEAVPCEFAGPPREPVRKCGPFGSPPGTKAAACRDAAAQRVVRGDAACGA